MSKKRVKKQDMALDDEIKDLREKYTNFVSGQDSAKFFTDFPLSRNTLKGLVDEKYTQPTEIQQKSIGYALQGKDVLATAITGSGKTLAFLIPILEHLFVKKWTRMDGVGAIIISPTRELAYQIFDVLKKVGKHHDFSAGLIIGGKNLKFERSRMDQCNILVCTPGRLLQHMDTNPLFDSSTLQLLVLDEADRCLDLGFEDALNAIIENLPPERQTLLFSATQTTSVKDLARLNLCDPVYIGCAKDVSSMRVPELLQQSYVVIDLADKVTMLWSFIKNHLKQKMIIFFATCKQVKYMYEIFSKLRPGTSLLALYGSLHQDRRIAVYNEFLRKSNVVLFATDVASRGLDFPAVNWVVQMDCPEDVAQYVHRAGRSARNKSRGENLLVLLPSEENGMIEDLNENQITLKKIHIDPKKLFSPGLKIQGFIAQNPELKASAQRAFIAYLKSVLIMKKKNIFKISELNFDAFAMSLGLVVTPRVKFLSRFTSTHVQKVESTSRATDAAVESSMVSNVQRKAKTFDQSDSDSEDDLITLKRSNHEINNDETTDDIELEIPRRTKVVSKASIAKRVMRKNVQLNTKLKFGEDGSEILPPAMHNDSNVNSGIDIEESKRIIQEEDKYDKQRFRELVKKQHRNLKQKSKQENDELESSDGESNVDSSYALNTDNESDSNQVSDNEGTAESENGYYESDMEDDSSDEINVPKKKLKLTEKMSIGDIESIAAQLLTSK